MELNFSSIRGGLKTGGSLLHSDPAHQVEERKKRPNPEGGNWGMFRAGSSGTNQNSWTPQHSQWIRVTITMTSEITSMPIRDRLCSVLNQ